MLFHIQLAGRITDIKMHLSLDKLVWLVTLQLCLGAHVTAMTTTAKASTTSSTLQSSTPPVGSQDPINKAVGPLYSMTDGFMHTVFPSGVRVDTIRKWFLTFYIPPLLCSVSNYGIYVQPEG